MYPGRERVAREAMPMMVLPKTCKCTDAVNIGKVIGEREAEEGYHKQKVKYWHPLLKSGNISYSELYLYSTGYMYACTYMAVDITHRPSLYIYHSVLTVYYVHGCGNCTQALPVYTPQCTHIDVVLVCT